MAAQKESNAIEIFRALGDLKAQIAGVSAEVKALDAKVDANLLVNKEALVRGDRKFAEVAERIKHLETRTWKHWLALGLLTTGVVSAPWVKKFLGLL